MAVNERFLEGQEELRKDIKRIEEKIKPNRIYDTVFISSIVSKIDSFCYSEKIEKDFQGIKEYIDRNKWVTEKQADYVNIVFSKTQKEREDEDYRKFEEWQKPKEYKGIFG